MADLSKVKIGSAEYNLKDAAARDAIGDETKGLIKSLADEAAARAAADTALQTNIDNEASARATADSGLDTRIKALESKGRFLSTWDATTGKPDTYPEISQLVEGKYNYRSGDYYIVNKVNATVASNLMPDGAYISYDSATTTWTVPTKAFSGTTLNLGDQFQYDGTKWTHIASATTVAFANIQGDAEDNENLAGKLAAKVDKTQTIAGIDLQDNITKAELQSALELAALAYKASATGTVSGQTVTGVKAAFTPEGTVAVTVEQESVAASLTKAAYTPAGTVTGDAIKGGSIAVTLKEGDATKEATLTRGDYIPAGTVAIEESETGVQISGTVSKPAITVNDSTKDTFVKSLKAGTTAAASFTEGAFTPAAFQSGFVTAGEDASLSAGAQASLTAQSKAKFVKKAHSFTVGTGTDAETLIIGEVENTDTTYYTDAVTDRGTFTANTLQTLTGGKATVIDTTKFSGGSKAADTFAAEKLPVVDGTASAVTAVSAELAAAPTFTGDKFAATFTGTKEADLKVTKAEYKQSAVDTATFTGTAATLGFEGTQVADFQVTGVNYSKVKENGATATFTGTAGEASVGTITIADKNVTVS